MQQLQTNQSYSDPIMESLIDKISKDEFDLIGVSAKHDGLLNEPGDVKNFNVKVVKPVKSVIQKTIDFNYSRFQPHSEIAIMQNQRIINAGKVAILTKEKNQVEKKLTLLKNEIKKIKECLGCGIGSKLRKIIPALFGSSEGFLVFNMLQNASLPATVAILMAFVVALTAGFGVHLGAHFICKAPTAYLRRVRHFIVLGIGLFISLGLGVWRASMYSTTSNINSQIDLNQTSASSQSYSAWPFVILSFVSFLVGLAFELRFWRSEDEQKQLQLYNDKRNEAKKDEQQIQAIQHEINSINDNTSIDSSAVIRKQEYACGNEQRLVTLAQHIINHYEKTNTEFRTDNQCPQFFGEPIDFEFKLYFTPLFNHKT